jgi:L-aspartate oxidase
VPAAAVPTVATLRNLAETGRLIARAALERTESRGAHWRDDYPVADPAWQRRQIVYAANRPVPAPDERRIAV